MWCKCHSSGGQVKLAWAQTCSTGAQSFCIRFFDDFKVAEELAYAVAFPDLHPTPQAYLLHAPPGNRSALDIFTCYIPVSGRHHAGLDWKAWQYELALLPEAGERIHAIALPGLGLPGCSGSSTQLRTTEVSSVQRWFSARGDATFRKVVEGAVTLERLRTTWARRDSCC